MSRTLCSGAEGRSVKKTVRWTVFSVVHEGLCPRADVGSNSVGMKERFNYIFIINFDDNDFDSNFLCCECMIFIAF